jgi:hypothetical protein
MNDILNKIKYPAFGLLITAIINLVWGVIRITGNVYVLITKPGLIFEPIEITVINVLGIIFGILSPVLSFLAAPIIIYGVIQMKKGKNYKLAVTSATLAIIPFTSCCFLVGVPFGIWALLVLKSPEVFEFFQKELNFQEPHPPLPPKGW